MKHEIEIPDLPEGWEAVAYRVPKAGEYFFSMNGIKYAETDRGNLWLIVSKKQPSRIVLEETGQVRKPMDGEYVQNNGNYYLCRKPERWGNDHEIWKIVEDNKCEE